MPIKQIVRPIQDPERKRRLRVGVGSHARQPRMGTRVGPHAD